MGFKTGDFPPVDPETYLDRPFLERVRIAATQWVEYGFGSPKMVQMRQLVMRRRIALDPYSTGIAGTLICSASTPPGAGAHGMCGYHAANSALRHLKLPPID